MGVYIKGMEMPMNCRQCNLYLQSMDSERNVYENCAVTAKSYNWGLTTLPSDCPLVPVPPHGRLIDADEISKHKYATIPPYRKEYSDGKPKSEDEVIAFKFGWNDAIDAIVANAPTIIEAEGDE